MMGRFDAAMKLANDVANTLGRMLKEMPPLEMAEAYPVQVLTRFGRWKDVLKMKPIDAGPLSNVLWHYAHGTALAQLGNVSGAMSDRKALEAARAKLTDDTGLMQNPSKAIGTLAAQVLDGRIALAAGRTDEGIAALRKAVVMEDELDYDEPPD